MREDAQEHLAPLRRKAARAECGAQAPLEAAEATLDVPARAVGRFELARPAPLEAAPVRREGPAAAHRARVDRDEHRAHAEPLMREDVMAFGVIGAVGEDRVERDEPARLADERAEGRRILRGPALRPGGEPEMRAHVEHDAQLGPRADALPTALPRATADAEVLADVMALEPRGIDGDDRRRLGDQAEGLGARRDRVLEAAEGPPFSAPARSRCSA